MANASVHDSSSGDDKDQHIEMEENTQDFLKSRIRGNENSLDSHSSLVEQNFGKGKFLSKRKTSEQIKETQMFFNRHKFKLDETQSVMKDTRNEQEFVNANNTNGFNENPMLKNVNYKSFRIRHNSVIPPKIMS